MVAWLLPYRPNHRTEFLGPLFSFDSVHLASFTQVKHDVTLLSYHQLRNFPLM